MKQMDYATKEDVRTTADYYRELDARVTALEKLMGIER